MRTACFASSPAGAMWLIIRKPDTSMPSSRAVAMCCAETSASVQCVATRTERTPREYARFRSPMPGNSKVVKRAFSMLSAAASIHSQSEFDPGP